MSAVIADRPDLVLRPMTRADIALVERLERSSYPYPWSGGIFRDCLAAGYCCEVLAHRGGLAGYGVMSVAVGEAHILNLCIAEQHRHHGLGRRLLEHFIEVAQERGADHLFLEVRPSNAAARRLYESAGFNQIGTRPNYYPDLRGREDALILALDLSVASAI